MTAQHTPGPWTAEFQKYGSAIAADNVCIATTHGTAAITGTALPHEHNARLIAAAPDLLAALHQLDGFLSWFFPKGPNESSGADLATMNADIVRVWKSARDAITKATETQP